MFTLLLIGMANVIAAYLVEAFNAPIREKLGMLKGFGLLSVLWIIGIVLFKST